MKKRAAVKHVAEFERCMIQRQKLFKFLFQVLREFDHPDVEIDFEKSVTWPKQMQSCFPGWLNHVVNIFWKIYCIDYVYGLPNPL